jgi:hypothetical protein
VAGSICGVSCVYNAALCLDWAAVESAGMQQTLAIGELVASRSGWPVAVQLTGPMNCGAVGEALLQFRLLASQAQAFCQVGCLCTSTC